MNLLLIATLLFIELFIQLV